MSDEARDEERDGDEEPSSENAPAAQPPDAPENPLELERGEPGVKRGQ